MTGIDAYPLAWPAGWKRTSYPGRSKFKTSFAVARDQLFRELKLMGVRNSDYSGPKIVLSTNVPLRRDGLPLAGQSNPKDAGVSVYFSYKDKPMVFACDSYTKVEENLYAIVKTIEALRGIQRWGASDMMERSFTGFAALPPARAAKRDWWAVLGVDRHATRDQIAAAWRQKSFEHHPDRGGSQDAMTEVNIAYNEGMKA